ncbi:MAG: hypothetical protein ACQESR_12880 [Planctomycetota bacterium]
MADLEQSFEHWQAMAELQVQFLEALGEYKLRVAKSGLAKAVTAQNWALARMKATVAMELEAALKRLRQQRNKTHRKIERLGRHGRAASKIRSGEDLSASQLALMWGGYTVFERLTPVSVLQELTDTALHPTAGDGQSYADAMNPDQPCPDPPHEVDNVLALIGWLKEHRFVPRRGTQAYRQVIGAFSKIAAVATTQIESLRGNLKALEHGTYDNWRPLLIAALPDAVDANKIINLDSK